MPRSTIGNRRAKHYDAANELRPQLLPAVTANTNGTATPVVAYAIDEFKAVINTAPYSGFAVGTAFWEAAIEASADNVTFIQVAKTPLKSALFAHEIALSGQSIEQIVPNAQYLRLVAQKVGAPGALAYSGYLSPDE
jgi:hypothetical protein